MSAIITTARSIKALIITRSLGRRGVRVTTGDQRKHALASLSRYSASSFLYSSPQHSPSEFIAQLVEFTKDNKHEVLIPTHFEDTYIIAQHKSEFEPFIKVPLHDYSSIMQAHDKGFVMQLAEELGIPVPRTIFISDFDELHRQAEKIQLPAVIKLRTGSSSIGISYVRTKEEMVTEYKHCVSRFGLAPENYPLIQEYIPGDGYGVALLFNHGELRAKFTHKRLREYPPSGGPSTYRISVENPEMEEIAIKLLQYFHWHGVAMVEFKLDRRSDKPVLIEINPRFWGSVNQAICSGVDFPYLLYRMAIDGDVEPVLSYKLGIKTRVLFIDYVTLLHSLWNSKQTFSTMREFFHLCPDDIISTTDPIPALGFLYSGLRDRVKKDYLLQ